MRYPEKLMEGREGVALDAAKSPPAEMVSVVSHCLPSLYRYAYRMLGNKTDAEDAVQDALLAAYKHLNQFPRRGATFDVADHYCYQLRENAFAQAFTLHPRFPRFANRRRAGVSAL
jgi:Sigma-70 region 2